MEPNGNYHPLHQGSDNLASFVKDTTDPIIYLFQPKSRSGDFIEKKESASPQGFRRAILFFAMLLFCLPVCGRPAAAQTKLSANSGNYSADSAGNRGVYHVNYPISGSIIGIGAFSDYFAISTIKNKHNISDLELSALNKDVINSIDRWALRQDASKRKSYSSLSDYYQVSMFLLPGFLMLDKKVRSEWFDLLTMYVEGHILTFSLYNYSWFGPTFNNKYRPLVYYPELSDRERKGGNNRNSFYSGHTASSTYSTFFLAKVYCDYHPDLSGGTELLIYTSAFTLGAIEGYFRVKSLAHFPSDCMVGLSLGALVGIILPEMHKNRHSNPTFGLIAVPGGTGISASWDLR